MRVPDGAHPSDPEKNNPQCTSVRRLASDLHSKRKASIHEPSCTNHSRKWSDLRRVESQTALGSLNRWRLAYAPGTKPTFGVRSCFGRRWRSSCVRGRTNKVAGPLRGREQFVTELHSGRGIPSLAQFQGSALIYLPP